MYQTKEFPKERIEQIKKESGCIYWHEERMLAVSLLDEARDQSDILWLLAYDDYANKMLENARANRRARLQKEMEAWNAVEHEKFCKAVDEEGKKFREKLEEAYQKGLAAIQVW